MDPRVSPSESARCADLNASNYVRGTLANFGELLVLNSNNESFYSENNHIAMRFLFKYSMQLADQGCYLVG